MKTIRGGQQRKTLANVVHESTRPSAALANVVHESTRPSAALANVVHESNQSNEHKGIAVF